jgi:hypothetical protein
VTIVLYRRQVFHETRKNFQLDLFDLDDGHYEYPAIVTNKRLSAANLWRFPQPAGEPTRKLALAELKDGFAFDTVATQRYRANCACWQILSVLAFNLSRGFQAANAAEPHPQPPLPLPVRVDPDACASSSSAEPLLSSRLLAGRPCSSATITLLPTSSNMLSKRYKRPELSLGRG